MRQDALVLRRLVALAVVGVAVVGACTLDEAELYEAGSPTITAEVGQLRVLSYDDVPADDDWIDVVRPDPDVVEEGDGFREADSRTADDDQPAEQRRLLTGVDAGRTVLVQFDAVDRDVQVWELVVGASDSADVTAGDGLARAGTVLQTTSDGYFAVVRDGSDGRADAVETDGVDLVGAHTPEDGADLWVDVYRAVAQGESTVVYELGDTMVEYPVTAG